MVEMKKWSSLDQWSLRILGVLLWLASAFVFAYGVVLLQGIVNSAKYPIEFWAGLYVVGPFCVLSIGAGLAGFYFGWRVFLSGDDAE